jgi:hypothetical protein
VQDQLVPDNRPAKFPPQPGAEETNAPPPETGWFAASGVAIAILGLFVAQILLGPVAIVVSALAWHASGHDAWARKLVLFGYGLGVLDCFVWLICESVFSIRLIPF